MAGAGYRDWTAGEKPTAAQFDTYLQEQTVMVFADAAARNTALSAVLAEGLRAFLLDTNTLTVYSGSAWSTVGPEFGAWTSYTPTWTGTIGNGTLAGAYSRVGRSILWRASVTWGSTTSHAASTQAIGLPVAARSVYVNTVVGWAGVDIGGTKYPGSAWIASSTTVNGYYQGSANAWSNTVPATWVNGNSGILSGMYEAAADA
jgi:hypothetical protein